MSSILSINHSIVPAHVTEGYIKGYKVAEQKAIATLYDSIKENALKELSGTISSSRPTVLLVAGSQGSGKSKLVESLLQKRKEKFVECDVDSILKQMPLVKEELNKTERDFGEQFEMAGTAHYDASSHRGAVETVIAKWRPAAKYISDRLMSECIAEGINVIVETNAKTPRIKDFIESLKAKDIILEGHICEAPLPLKINSARTPEHGFAFPEDVLVSENEAFRENIPDMVSAMKDNLSIWFRLRKFEPAKMAACMIDEKFIAGEALDTFDAAFVETKTPMDIARLFGLSRQIPASNVGVTKPAREMA